MKKLKVLFNGESFEVRVRNLKTTSNHNVSVNVFDSMGTLICGWHEKHTKSMAEVKGDVIHHLSHENEDLKF